MADLSRRALVTAALLAAPALARADSRPMRVIVPFGAGGSTDAVARLVMARVAEKLGQNLVVENRSGGSGTVAAAAAALAPPDGTALLLDGFHHVVNPAVMRGLAFDYAAFVPVSLVTVFPMALTVRQNFPAQDLAGFLEAARREPGRVSIANTGTATAGHLIAVQLARATGTQPLLVPYRGGADAIRDVAAGVVDAAVSTIPSISSVVESGRGRSLALAAARRAEARPHLPCFAELGVPDPGVAEWAPLLAPPGTPESVVLPIHAALSEALADPAIRTRLIGLGGEVVGSAPEAFRAQLAAKREEMAALVREANITVNS